MIPRLAICNIFGQEADRLADFAHLTNFEGIDWTIDQNQSEGEFVSKINALRGLEVRFHCPFEGIDISYKDKRAEKSLEFLTHTAERVAMAGGKHMTVHLGFGKSSDKELDFDRAVENLTSLVHQGAEFGVSISLENLTNPWTNDPLLFTTLVDRSGAGVTLDIGHIHAVEQRYSKRDIYEMYILPNQQRIFNVHIYHTERSGFGHMPPETLEDIRDRLELLRGVECCNWWVIELQNIEDILYTRKLLNRYFKSLTHRSPRTCINYL